MGPVVESNHLVAGFSCFNRNIESVQQRIRCLTGGERPVDNPPEEHVNHTVAIAFSLPDRVVGNAPAPQLVGNIRGELTVHEVRRRDELFAVQITFPGPGRTRQHGLRHHPGNLVAAKANAGTPDQLGMQPSNEINASVRAVEVHHLSCEHFVANRSLAPRPVTPMPESAIGPTKREALCREPDALPGRGFNGRVATCGRIPTSFAK